MGYLPDYPKIPLLPVSRTHLAGGRNLLPYNVLQELQILLFCAFGCAPFHPILY